MTQDLDQGYSNSIKGYEKRVEMAITKMRPVIVIDCCNVSAMERKQWLDMAKEHGLQKDKIWCVYTKRSVEECSNRMKTPEHKQSHPHGRISGLPYTEQLLELLGNKIEEPKTEEGFEHVFVIDEDKKDIPQAINDLK